MVEPIKIVSIFEDVNGRICIHFSSKGGNIVEFPVTEEEAEALYEELHDFLYPYTDFNI